MFDVGDVVEIFAPQAGHKKYHICICVNAGAAHQFLYLNSDPRFDGTLAFDCARVPCIPASKTGKTVLSFAIIARYNDHQLKLYNAKKLGVLEPSVASEALAFAETVKTLNSVDRALVTAALAAIAGPLNAPPAANTPSIIAKQGE